MYSYKRTRKKNAAYRDGGAFYGMQILPRRALYIYIFNIYVDKCMYIYVYIYVNIPENKMHDIVPVVLFMVLEPLVPTTSFIGNSEHPNGGVFAYY